MLLLRTAGRALVHAMRLGTVVIAGLTVEQEFSRRRRQRTWHGRVGPVPYDFRRPTMERLRREWWQPDSAELVTPHAFGLGWGLNLGRLAAMLQRSARR